MLIAAYHTLNNRPTCPEGFKAADQSLKRPQRSLYQAGAGGSGGANAPVWHQCPQGAQSYQPTNEGSGIRSAQLLDTEWEDTDICGNPGSEAPLLILMFVLCVFV